MAGADSLVLWEPKANKDQVRRIWTGIVELFRTSEGEVVAAHRTGANIEVWKVQPAKRVATLRGDDQSLSCTTVSSDGKVLASGSADKVVRLWRIASEKNTATHKLDGQVTCLSFSPDGGLLAAGYKDKKGGFDGGFVRVWHVASGKELAIFRAHERPLFCLAFSPDGRTLASGSADHTIGVWDVRTFSDPR